MESCEHLDRGLHNEKVCNYLGKKNDYADWVVTTAFYAAIHFVRSLMVPIGSDKQTFETYFRQTKGLGEGRHGFQERYVQEHHSSIGFEYKKLHEMSNQARYLNHSFARESATASKRYLSSIKGYVQETTR